MQASVIDNRKSIRCLYKPNPHSSPKKASFGKNQQNKVEKEQAASKSPVQTLCLAKEALNELREAVIVSLQEDCEIGEIIDGLKSDYVGETITEEQFANYCKSLARRTQDQNGSEITQGQDETHTVTCQTDMDEDEDGFLDPFEQDLPTLPSYSVKLKVIEWIKSEKECPHDAILKIKF